MGLVAGTGAAYQAHKIPNLDLERAVSAILTRICSGERTCRSAVTFRRAQREERGAGKDRRLRVVLGGSEFLVTRRLSVPCCGFRVCRNSPADGPVEGKARLLEP